MRKPVAPFLLSFLGLFGCSDESRVDVSQQPEFRDIVGTKYEAARVKLVVASFFQPITV